MGYYNPIENTEIYDYCKPNRPLQMDQADLSSQWTKMVFRLSSGQYTNAIINSIHRSFMDFEFSEQGNYLTVSGNPPDANFVEDDVLAIVRKHDPRAVKV